MGAGPPRVLASARVLLSDADAAALRTGFFANGFVFLSGFGAVVYCFFYTLQVRCLHKPCGGTVGPLRRRPAPHCALRPHAALRVAQGIYADIPTVSEAVYAQVR